jgi:tetratricopeptide (TPR) repeat protein
LESLRSRSSIKQIEKELEAQPENWYLYYQRGLLLAEQRDHENAIAAYTQAVQLTQPDPPRYLLAARADSYLRLNNRAAGIRDLTAGFDLEAASSQEVNDLAIQLAISDPKQVPRFLNELIRRGNAPSNPMDMVYAYGVPRLLQAMVNSQSGNWPEALQGFAATRAIYAQMFGDASRLEPGFAGQLDFFESIAMLASGNLDGYREMCRRLAVDPEVINSPVRASWVARIAVLLPDSLDDFEILASLAKESVRVQPLNAGRQITYGQILYRAGNFAESCLALEEGIRLVESAHGFDKDTRESGRRMPHLWLAMAQHRLGGTENARKAYEEAIVVWKRMREEDAIQLAPEGHSWLTDVADQLLLPEVKQTLGIEDAGN